MSKHTPPPPPPAAAPPTTHTSFAEIPSHGHGGGLLDFSAQCMRVRLCVCAHTAAPSPIYPIDPSRLRNAPSLTLTPDRVARGTPLLPLPRPSDAPSALLSPTARLPLALLSSRPELCAPQVEAASSAQARKGGPGRFRSVVAGHFLPAQKRMDVAFELLQARSLSPSLPAPLTLYLFLTHPLTLTHSIYIYEKII
jgi:hypothetical protein